MLSFMNCLSSNGFLAPDSRYANDPRFLLVFVFYLIHPLQKLNIELTNNTFQPRDTRSIQTENCPTNMLPSNINSLCTKPMQVWHTGYNQSYQYTLGRYRNTRKFPFSNCRKYSLWCALAFVILLNHCIFSLLQPSKTRLYQPTKLYFSTDTHRQRI